MVILLISLKILVPLTILLAHGMMSSCPIDHSPNTFYELQKGGYMVIIYYPTGFFLDSINSVVQGSAMVHPYERTIPELRIYKSLPNSSTFWNINVSRNPSKSMQLLVGFLAEI